MPYEIRKFDKGFKVCKEKEDICFSKKPIPKYKAKKQLKAIGISESKGGTSFQPSNMELYNKVKKDVYKRIPKHSLYRSAIIQKEYQDKGGEYKGQKEDDIGKWMAQKWISLNDYVRGDIVKCGQSNTQEKFKEYPLCRPLAIAKKLNKNQIKKMIIEKNKLEEKQLKTADILGTDKYNIKWTMTGTGQDLPNRIFKKKLEDIKFDPNDYLELAKLKAFNAGYDPELLNFSPSLKHKLQYDGIDFGGSSNNDFIIYNYLSYIGKVNKNIPSIKQKSYLARSEKIKGDWEKNIKSPNNLARSILW